MYFNILTIDPDIIETALYERLETRGESWWSDGEAAEIVFEDLLFPVTGLLPLFRLPFVATSASSPPRFMGAMRRPCKTIFR